MKLIVVLAKQREGKMASLIVSDATDISQLTVKK